MQHRLGEYEQVACNWKIKQFPNKIVLTFFSPSGYEVEKTML
jgi:hypothetical protein